MKWKKNKNIKWITALSFVVFWYISKLLNNFIHYKMLLKFIGYVVEYDVVWLFYNNIGFKHETNLQYILCIILILILIICRKCVCDVVMWWIHEFLFFKFNYL